MAKRTWKQFFALVALFAFAGLVAGATVYFQLRISDKLDSRIFEQEEREAARLAAGQRIERIERTHIHRFVVWLESGDAVVFEGREVVRMRERR